MDIAFEALRILSIGAFLVYGIHCLLSRAMEAEFERYGLARFRTLTGGCQIAGALGLLASYAVPSLAVFAAAGLSLLMALGVWTRIRIGDPLPAMLPALFFMGVNAWVAVYAVYAVYPVDAVYSLQAVHSVHALYTVVR